MQLEESVSDSSDEQLSLGELGSAFKRRWYVLLGSIAFCLLAGLAGYRSASRMYTAVASVNVNPPESSGGGDLAALASPLASADFLETETAVLESETLADITIRRLNLMSNPSFMTNPLHSSGLEGANDPRQRELAMAAWKRSIKVAVFGKTHLIDISATTRDPRLSSDIANALVDSYIAHNYQSHYDVAQQASEWLSSQLSKLRTSAETAQKNLIDYQRRSGLITGDKAGGLIIEEISDLTHSLTQAQSERILAESQLQIASASDKEILGALYSDSTLQALATQRDVLDQQLSSESSRLGPRYPKVIADQQQLATVDRDIAARISALRAAFQKRFEEAMATERSFQSRLDTAKTKAYETSSSGIELAIRQKEVEAANDLYQTVSARLQSAGVSAGLAATNVQRLDLAHPPALPASPVFFAYLGSSTLAGLFLGMALAYVIDRLMDRIESGERVEAIIGSPLLGTLPKVLKDSVLHHVVQGGNTDTPSEEGIDYLESCRAIRSSIMFSPREGGTKSIALTSGGPGEGKSTVAENLAVVFARPDRKVLLVDADLRRPVLAKRLGFRHSAGLSDVLVGTTLSSEAITEVHGTPGLYLLSAGTPSPRASELLDSPHLATLFADLRAQFDMVIVDTPPITLVNDAVLIAKLVDELIIVSRAGVTRERALQEVRRIIRRAHVSVAGVILNAAKSKRGYYSSSYYQALPDHEA